MNISRVGVELWPGAESMGYELTSDLMAVTIADLGAHLASVVLRLEDNEELQINVGYPPGATDGTGYHGASVGRYANRIAGSRFELDGVGYEVESNEGVNQLHGGPDGFNAFAWSADSETDGDTGRVVLRHKSKFGEMGFPGKVKANVTFELAGNKLTISYRATADEPTPVNMTNHVYWNLAGEGTLDGHELTVAAAAYIEVDAANIPVLGPPAAVRGSRFNCNSGRSLAAVVEAGGYDHCFVLDADAKPQVTLRHESGRRIDIVTDQIGLQAYTGQHLDPNRRGIALETQCLPDTPNRPDFGDCTVRPGQDYLASTTFTFFTSDEDAGAVV
ncbi:MAG: galactose mutarotase [Acidimicrobiales bacterium]|nr:galactose mutarotase [Acidimicrobiales bacterium]